MNTVPDAITERSLYGKSLWQHAFDRLRKNRAATISLGILVFMIILVIVGPLLSPHDFDRVYWDAFSQPPNISKAHFFGTDSSGRDLFVRVLMGGRLSLMIGVISTAVSLLIGILYGAIAGFIGGKVDAVMMRIVDILYALPFMFLVILLMVMFGRHIILIFVAIGAINWLDMARIVRGQTLSLKERTFVEAARSFGIKKRHIIFRHIIPNILGIVAIYVTLTIPQVILAESFLSFLGLGVQEPFTSWGALVNEGAQELEVALWTLMFPAFFLATTLFCFNFLGDGLRDALDPKDY
ncbi:peptide ABC transporter permease [Candidatus Marinamargulisbacteria bacterium SCGC AG-414-C22]|nr:peptide ABC transporter permease [Candidatus Marinamargulisbacteria bacterium SCGC AG-414-C22]